MYDERQSEPARMVRQALLDVRRVLLDVWDPIGVRDEPDAQNEYDGYAGGVYRLLSAGATDEQVIEHLRSIETERMGLRGDDTQRLLRTVEALRTLNIDKE